MDLNRGNMDSLFTSYNQAFRNAFGMGSALYLPFCTIAPSGTKIEEFPFLEQFSGMREWIGPRLVKNIASKKLQIVNRTFEDTIGVPVNDIEDDKFGVYTPILGQMGLSAANLWPDLFMAALVGNGNWLDGAAFFGTTRKYGDNTISNYTASALSATTFEAAYQAMTSFKGHGDYPLRVRPTHLIVGPKLRSTAFHILKDEFVNDGVAATSVQLRNPNQGLVELVELPELVGTDDDYWFLIAANGIVKPVIISQREQPKLVRKDRAEDDNVFLEDKILYGTKARGEAALALPHLAYAGIVA